MLTIKYGEPGRQSWSPTPFGKLRRSKPFPIFLPFYPEIAQVALAMGPWRDHRVVAARGMQAVISWRLFVGLARIRYIAGEHAGRRR